MFDFGDGFVGPREYDRLGLPCFLVEDSGPYATPVRRLLRRTVRPGGGGPALAQTPRARNPRCDRGVAHESRSSGFATPGASGAVVHPGAEGLLAQQQPLMAHAHRLLDG